jgi:hypothetical protein
VMELIGYVLHTNLSNVAHTHTRQTTQSCIFFCFFSRFWRSEFIQIYTAKDKTHSLCFFDHFGRPYSLSSPYILCIRLSLSLNSEFFVMLLLLLPPIPHPPCSHPTKSYLLILQKNNIKTVENPIHLFQCFLWLFFNIFLRNCLITV